MKEENKLTALEKEIISILSEDLLGEELYDRELEISPNSTDTELVKKVFNSQLESAWDCNISTAHKLADCLRSLPCDLVPTGLFEAAMETAMGQVNWEAIAQHESISAKIRSLKQA